MFTHQQAEAGISPELARVQVLGREIATMIDDHERRDCARFVRCMRDDATHTARFVRVMTQPQADRDDLLARRLDVLTAALGLDRTA